jgi:hypothetical protein
MRGITQEMFEGLDVLYEKYGESPFNYKDITNSCDVVKYKGSFFRTLLVKRIITTTQRRFDNQRAGQRVHTPSKYRLTDETINAILRWRKRHDLEK